MTNIVFIEPDGRAVTVSADAGQSLMQVAVAKGISGIVAECGGAAACGTCHCYIAEDWVEKLSKPKANELDMLEFVIDPEPVSRLSCQIEVTPELEGLIVRVPASQT